MGHLGLIYHDLPISSISDSIRWIEVNALHLAFHSLTIQQGVHHKQTVTLNESVLPVVAMLVVASQTLQLILLFICPIAKEVELQLGTLALMLMQFVEVIDDGLWTDVLMLIQTADICSQLGHIIRVVFIVVLVLA